MLMGAGINGKDTYEQIISMHPNQKAVIVSGFSENDDVKQAAHLGARGFLKKPYTMEQLATAVFEELQQ